MEKQIDEFISMWKESGKIIDEHTDFFDISKKSCTYNDVCDIINKINEKCRIEEIDDDVDVIAYIECGNSKRIQKWGDDFWKLVDYSDTPPVIVMGKGIIFHNYNNDYEEIIKDDKANNEDYINIYTSDFDGGVYTRRLHIITRRIIKKMDKNIWYAVSDISRGDCDILQLFQKYPQELMYNLLDYMKTNNHIFFVDKEFDGKVETVHIVDKCIRDFDDYTNIAVELTPEGRRKYNSEYLIEELIFHFK